MVDLFRKIYPSVPVSQPGILNKLKLYSAARQAVRLLANILLPVFFKVENRFVKHAIDGGEPNLIVSMTTFPARIDKVWLVIESIFRQTVKPEKLILWLSKDQFPNGLDDLPDVLRRQTKRGLNIVFCDGDLRSHKKYYCTLKEYPDYDFITIDDDFFYPSDMIETLLRHRDGRLVVAHRALDVTFSRDGFQSYSSWKLKPDKLHKAPSVFATSGAGTYFPAGALHSDATRKDLFMKYCPMADDVWLYFMALMNGTETLKTNFSPFYIPVLNVGGFKLSEYNVGGGQNDEQIRRVVDYYSTDRGVDFKGILSAAAKCSDRCRD